MWVWLKLTPKVDFCLVSVRAFFVNFFTHSTKRYLDGHQTLLVRPKSAICTPKRDDEHPCHFYMKVLPPPPHRKPMYTLSVSITMLTRQRSPFHAEHCIQSICFSYCLTRLLDWFPLFSTEVCYSCILGRTYFVAGAQFI